MPRRSVLQSASQPALSSGVEKAQEAVRTASAAAAGESRDETGAVRYPSLRLGWTSEMDLALISHLVDVINRNAAPDSSFKAATWVEALPKIAEVTPLSQRPLLTAGKVKNKHAALRKEYSIWRAVVSQSGFSRDPPETGPVIAPFQVMETYFSSHPGARKYSLAPIEHEELLTALFDGRLADGRHSQGFGGLLDSVMDDNSGELFTPQVNGSGSLPLSQFLEDEDSAGEDEDDELSQLSATSAARRQPEGQSAEPETSTPATPSSAISQRSALATHMSRKVRNPLHDEIGRGLASIVDIFAAQKSPVTLAMEIINRDLVSKLPPVKVARLARILTVTANAEMFVGLTDPTVRSVLIDDWLGASSGGEGDGSTT